MPAKAGIHAFSREIKGVDGAPTRTMTEWVRSRQVNALDGWHYASHGR
jgi:hypothetical protein